jgi:hypothetical protein
MPATAKTTNTTPSNPGKKTAIQVGQKTWDRLPIKTHLVTDVDDMHNLVDQYVVPLKEVGDILFISERIVAITQGRAYPIDYHQAFTAS